MGEEKLLRLKTLKELKSIGLYPRKNIKGQHFLVDSYFLQKIIDTASLSQEDRIFEIGAGTGNLTFELGKSGADVIALENDINLLSILTEKFRDFSNVKIVSGDFKKINLAELLRTENSADWKVVSNLPYYLTNYIILALLEKKEFFKSIVLTVQLEVGERLTSLPGKKSYGSITLFARYHSIVEIIEIIPPEVFLPRPEVYSAIIKITPNRIPPVYVKDEKVFFELIRAAFNMRRKTIRNAWLRSPLIKYTEAQIDEILNSTGIDSKRRGETLSLEEFAEVANCLCGCNDNT
ncbi:MAG TPA: 16S rRNA (adenine(1518)-N(6)/adenine(1519)-N(6))-dimethyltransferase RsmA [Candidatus Eremiobacteraeota bacterium]|nr:MAG: Ribosomal RNA small subunit methyltransferase A [bacterium ADurb.Bin363]HPZ06648.1 16S rRNA (adenine(1518)-N(6)/adenine(1519)-N(6))-dimethyltransferase RsmA [Candidatus Eremiobacteraeota bacterium]